MYSGSSAKPLHPHTLGNVWNLSTDEDGAMFYMSDQWDGRIFGFEERDRITLAQSPEVAIGIVSFGGGSSGVTRPMPHRWVFHLRDEMLEVSELDLAAEAAAWGTLYAYDQRRHALPTIVALSEPIASTVEADALPGAPKRMRLARRLQESKDALQKWGKILVVDRINLALLEGAPNTDETTADYHYAAIAKDLRITIAEVTGQAALPAVVVSQSGGMRDRGDQETILAEGRLHWHHYALDFIVATPKYPFRLMDKTPATLDHQSAMLVSELESRAIDAVHAGKEWFCPSLEEASLAGNQITARFTAMSDLVLDDGPHGFSVDGAEIEAVRVEGKSAIIDLKTVPEGDFKLCYAWGVKAETLDDKSANRGSLRDSWSDQSWSVPDTTLYRYALSGRVPVRVKSRS